VSDWKAIWTNRAGKVQKSGTSPLDDLLALNGFDGGAGSVHADDWLAFVSSIVDECEIKKGDSVLELGCGAGAFLYALQAVVGELEIFGIDYSPALLEVAQITIPDGVFTEADLRSYEIYGVYDIVVCHSVLQYLDEETVARLLTECLAKSRKTVAILDIPDRASRYESESAREAEFDEGEYVRKYSGLNHTYFDKAFFKSLCADGWELNEANSRIANYVNGEFRFSVLFQKTSEKAGIIRSEEN
jgi:SAM-dependent methyltransferase